MTEKNAPKIFIHNATSYKSINESDQQTRKLDVKKNDQHQLPTCGILSEISSHDESSKKSTTDEDDEDNSSYYEEYARSVSSTSSEYDETSNSSSSCTTNTSSTNSEDMQTTLNPEKYINTNLTDSIINKTSINEFKNAMNVEKKRKSSITDIPTSIETDNKINNKQFKFILKKNAENKMTIKQPEPKEIPSDTINRVLQAKPAQNSLVFVKLSDSKETIGSPANAQKVITKTNESKIESQHIDADKEDLNKNAIIEKLVVKKGNGNSFGTVNSNATIDDFENDELASRTSTPKMKRELLQLRKTVIQSKILTEFMHESSIQKNRKTRKLIALKQGDENSSDISLDEKAAALRRSRSRSCSKIAELHEENNGKTSISRFLSNQDYDKSSEKRSSSVFEGDYDISIDNEKSLEKWTSDEKLNKRTMRSQNLEFVQKQIKFLNRVNQDGDNTDNSDADVSSITDTKIPTVNSTSRLQMIEKTWIQPSKDDSDGFCWKCHSCGEELLHCSRCPRSFHYKCLKISNSKLEKEWICTECTNIENFNKSSNRSGKQILSQENLNQLLQFALNRAKLIKGHECFMTIQNESECPCYTKYIKHPVTLNDLQDKVTNKFFKSSEEFYSESKWIQHNALCYYGNGSKVINIAKSLVKIYRQEVNEIETCGECYLNANTRNDWFVEVCTKPHILLWAKLKGFPYWPAKAMGFNPPALVNVRFFGDHDRANVALRECFLYSEVNPNPITKQKNSKNSIAECVKEVDLHIEKLKQKFGSFIYAPAKCLYDPYHEVDQLELMMPGVDNYMKNLTTNLKRPLTFKIVKTADNNLSMIKKSDENQVSNSNINISNDSCKSSAATSPAKENINIDNTNNNSTVILNNANKSSLIIQKVNYVNDVDSSKTSKCNIPVHLLETTTESEAEKKSKESSELQDNIESYEITTNDRDYPVKKIKRIQSIVIKRRYDYKNTDEIKKTKSDSKVDSSEISTDHKNVNESVTAFPLKDIMQARNKRKISDNGSSNKSEKKMLLELNEDNQIDNICPPLVLLKQQQQNSINVNGTPKVSINSNSGIIITTTTTPTVTNNSVITIASSDLKQTTETTLSKSSSIDKLMKHNKSVTITRISSKDNTNTITNPDNSDINKKIFLLKHNLSEKKSEEENTIERTEINDTSLDNLTTSSNTDTTTKQVINFPVPFVEIKIENSETDDKITETSCNSEGITVNNEPQSSLTQSSVVQSNSELLTPMLLPKIIEIKQEIISDDENQSVTQKIESLKNGIEIDSTNPINNLHRISVRQFAAISNKTQTLAKNCNDQAKKVSLQEKVPSKSLQLKDIQKARKSFPNKSLPVQKIPPIASRQYDGISNKSTESNIYDIKNNINVCKNSNNMVYIPMEQQQQQQQQKSIPIPPLTAVSKTSLPNCSSSITNAITVNNTISSVRSVENSSNNSSNAAVNRNINVQDSVNLNMSKRVMFPTANSNSSNNSYELDSNSHMLSGFVTPSLAAAITDTIVRSPPKLVPKPTGPMQSDGDYLHSTEAGPVSKTLMENAHKMVDFFRSVIEDTIGDMTSNGVLEAKVVKMQLEMEKLKNTHNKELEELKKNTDLMLCEMRKSMEKEKSRVIAETRKQCELERIRSIEEVKKKQWCTICGKEAQFYCCWNVSYCDYPCQQKHWPRHMVNCGQNELNPSVGNSDSSGNNTTQRIGAKVSPYNVKEKNSLSNQTKEMPVVSGPVGGNITAVQQRMPMVPTMVRPMRMQYQRNHNSLSIPNQRYAVPLSLQSAPSNSTQPPYSLMNRESNWDLLNPNTNYQPCRIPTSTAPTGMMRPNNI